MGDSKADSITVTVGATPLESLRIYYLQSTTIQYFILHVHTPVRPLRIVVADPGIRDVVELVPTEAHEVVETLPFYRLDERLGEGVGLEMLGLDCGVLRCRLNARIPC